MEDAAVALPDQKMADERAFVRARLTEETELVERTSCIVRSVHREFAEEYAKRLKSLDG